MRPKNGKWNQSCISNSIPRKHGTKLCERWKNYERKDMHMMSDSCTLPAVGQTPNDLTSG